MTWLVITGSVLVVGGIQNAEIRYPVKEFPTYSACQERLVEQNSTGIYDGLIVQKTFEMMAMLPNEFSKHADELHIRLHCEGVGIGR